MKSEGKGGKKCLAYVAVFIVLQTIIITVFALIVMRVKSPKVRFGIVTAENFSSSNANASAPTISMDLKVQFEVKNTNFGHFKYQNSTVTILYQGVPVGQGVIEKGRAKARSTRRFEITIPVSLGNDINNGVLALTSHAKLSGKVHLVKVIKKKKSGQMNCTMLVNLGTRAIQDLKCK